MGKKLYLFRHAKSSWDYPALSDFERPLNKRGYRSIDIMAERILKKKITFDKILSSPALRAAYTARSIAEKTKHDPAQIEYTELLYDSSVNELRKILNSLKKDINTVAVFSHNPTLNSFAMKYLGNFYQNIPTLGMLAIEFSCENWSEISQNNSKIILFDYPKKVGYEQ